MGDAASWPSLSSVHDLCGSFVCVPLDQLLPLDQFALAKSQQISRNSSLLITSLPLDHSNRLEAWDPMRCVLNHGWHGCTRIGRKVRQQAGAFLSVPISVIRGPSPLPPLFLRIFDP